jgi:hypothetical protein
MGPLGGAGEPLRQVGTLGNPEDDPAWSARGLCPLGSARHQQMVVVVVVVVVGRQEALGVPHLTHLP